MIIFGVGSGAALIGTMTGILLLRHKLKPPVTDAELAELKNKLQSGEASLAAASADVKELRAKLAAQETAVLGSRQDLAKRDEQLAVETAEKQKEKALRTAAEKRSLELSAEIVVLSEKHTAMEAQVKQERGRADAAAGRLGSVEAEIDASKQKIQELTEQAVRLAAESTEHKAKHEEEGRIRLDRETQLSGEREAVRLLTAQLSELQNERAQLEVKLREEMGSTAKSRELLLMAQEKLSSAFKMLGTEGQNGNGNQTNGNGTQAALVAALVKSEVDAQPEPALVASASD